MAPVFDDIVRSWITARYDLASPVHIRLIRAYTNDVYAVRDAAGRYVLKLYGAGWRTEPEIAYEVDLLGHLAARGIAVARSLPGRDGRHIQRLSTPVGIRLALLYEHAPGAQPTPPFSSVLYERVGRAAAALHLAADDFAPSHPRRSMDTLFLLDQPAGAIAPLIADGAKREAFLATVHRLGAAIRTLATRGLDWGPCHGDLSLDNLHLTDDGLIVWYDFDSGGPGWRAMDLPGWAAFVPDAVPRAAAFLHGYRAVRQLDRRDVEAAPYLAAAVAIWGMQVDLERRVLARGNAAVAAYLAQKTGELRRKAMLLDIG